MLDDFPPSATASMSRLSFYTYTNIFQIESWRYILLNQMRKHGTFK